MRNKLPGEVVFRDLRVDDIEPLSQLHAVAWRQTYEPALGPGHQYPTAQLRKHQWQQKFATQSGAWFCIVVEYEGQLIGFASGNDFSVDKFPEIKGELNKFYLLKDYHGYGLGKRLFKEARQRLLDHNITNMIAFTDPDNPTGKFFEHMGGEKIFDAQGVFDGAYEWKDLRNG